MAAGYQDDLKERVRSANDIVEVINSYVPLKRAGANFQACCPFHQEKTPSFNVNPVRQFFHCFGCHKGGDVFNFVQEYEKISFPEAFKRLADRARIPIETVGKSESQKHRFLRESLYELHERLAEYWHGLLCRDAAGKEGRDYLERRGLDEAAMRSFRLGFAPHGWDTLIRWAGKQGYQAKLLESAGLVVRKESSDKIYDRFRRRLVFPIQDLQGRVIGFSGRLVDDQDQGGKYINSPETAIYQKGKVLFGMDKAREQALADGKIVICEGQLDLIACHLGGLTNVVAPLGTALTPEHASLLKRYELEVVLSYDSDGAGRKAVKRAFEELARSGLSVRVAPLPENSDPDSYIRENGIAAYRSLIDGAPDYLDYLLDRLFEDHQQNSESGIRAIVDGMREAIHQNNNEVVTDFYAQKTAQRLGVEVQSVFRSFTRQVKPKLRDEASVEESRKGSQPVDWLLEALVGCGENFPLEWLDQNLNRDWVGDELVLQALDFRRDNYYEGHPFELPRLLALVEVAEHRSRLTEAAMNYREVDNPQKQLTDIVLRLRNCFLDVQLSEVSRESAGVDPRSEQLIRLMKRRQDLQRFKRQELKAIPDV